MEWWHLGLISHFCPGKISDPCYFHNLVFPILCCPHMEERELMPYPLQNVRAKLQNPRKSVPRHRAIYRRSKSTKWERHHSIGKNIDNNTQFKSTHALFCVIINTEWVVNLTEPDEPCGWPVIHRANLLMKLKTSLTCKQPNSQTRIEA